MDDFAHSHYFFVRVGQVEIQLWPPTWTLLLIAGAALLAIAIAATVVISYLSHARRD